jgi:hypothetical protein
VHVSASAELLITAQRVKQRFIPTQEFAMVLHARRATYISVVSADPATVLTFNGSAVSIAVGAVAGALLCPVVARPISKRLPADVHPFIGNTTSMAVCTALVIAVLRLI